MNYNFIDNNLDFKSKILDFNNCKEEDLDVSNFKIDKNIKVIQEFKDKLLEYKDKKFLIVGDYDCDGVHSTTIIKLLFNSLNIDHKFYIPSRVKDGYGLNETIVRNAANNDFDIIICLDNGIVCNKEIELAYNLGLKVFIIDHHEYDVLPKVEAIIHSSLLPNEYSEACSAGLCYLLLTYFKDDDYACVLAGISTLADMVKVFGYNRYLLKEMIRLINEKDFYQIKLLLNTNKPIDYDEISFNYVPKLNSLSRMEPKTNINVFVEYLLSSKDVCISTIPSINETNIERKYLTNEYLGMCKTCTEDLGSINVVVLENILDGLCGIVANRLLSDYNKPVIVFAKVGDEYRGSGRSNEEISIYDYLNNISDLFLTFGGHDQALGLTLKLDKLDDLKKYIKDNPITSKDLKKDVIVLDEKDINISMIDILDSLKPFGIGFKEPSFVLNNIDSNNKKIIKDKYPKFYFSNPRVSAISFNTRFKDLKPNTLIGKLKRDNFNDLNVSFSIEDML